MKNIRIIPLLLLKNKGLVKTKKFGNPVYIGDPINAVRIFNKKEANELILLDISGDRFVKSVDYSLLEKVASEAFMPMSYGGGIASFNDAKHILNLGYEKIVLDSAVYDNPDLIPAIANVFGSQSIIVALDIKKDFFGRYKLTSKSNNKTHDINIESHIDNLIKLGVGEILVNAVDRDGMMQGLDINLVEKIAARSTVPVIACGGVGSIDDIKNLFSNTKASAVAAGSLFVFHGPHRAVLINYPSREVINEVKSLRD